MTDIKDLLGKAIGDEPPIGIDRDEVFRAGRQKVRRRRAFAAGGVVAAVVVAAVGAATLTNFISLDPEPTPPAVGDSQHAPPGPGLPVSSTPVSQKPPTGPRLTPQHAEQLTDRLFRSWYVSRDEVVPWHGDKTPAFRVKDGTYLYQSDLTSRTTEGVLEVTVDFAGPGTKASCGDIWGPYDSCAVVSQEGVAVAQATWKSPAGERRNMAVAVLPDGTRVAAMTSNFSKRFADADKVPSGGEPVLSMEKLTFVMVKSEFSVF
jgi:hypothetical protein